MFGAFWAVRPAKPVELAELAKPVEPVEPAKPVERVERVQGLRRGGEGGGGGGVCVWTSGPEAPSSHRLPEAASPQKPWNPMQSDMRNALLMSFLCS